MLNPIPATAVPRFSIVTAGFDITSFTELILAIQAEDHLRHMVLDKDLPRVGGDYKLDGWHLPKRLNFPKEAGIKEIVWKKERERWVTIYKYRR